jgi:hypothetical protein
VPTIGYSFLALVLLYLLALPAAEQRGSHLGLVALLLLGAGLLLGSTSVVAFYLGWELAAFAAWGIGRLAAESRAAAVFPLGPAGLFGTFLMLAALLLVTAPVSIPAWLAFNPHLSGLSALLLLTSVVLKSAGVLGTLRGRVVGARLDPGPALLVGPTLLLVGVYPVLRLLQSVGATEPWRDPLALGCAAFALLATLAALDERDFWVALGRGALASLGLVWWVAARGGDATVVTLGAALGWTGLGLVGALVTPAAGRLWTSLLERPISRRVGKGSSPPSWVNMSWNLGIIKTRTKEMIMAARQATTSG